jgi:hypothetical protein
MRTLIEISLIRIIAAKLGLDHYVVRLLWTDGIFRWYQFVEKTPQGIIWSDRLKIDGTWEILDTRTSPADLAAAIERLRATQNWNGYSLLSANCEQFARYIVQGQEISTQVRGALFAVGCAAAVAFLASR